MGAAFQTALADDPVNALAGMALGMVGAATGAFLILDIYFYLDDPSSGWGNWRYETGSGAFQAGLIIGEFGVSTSELILSPLQLARAGASRGVSKIDLKFPPSGSAPVTTTGMVFQPAVASYTATAPLGVIRDIERLSGLALGVYYFYSSSDFVEAPDSPSLGTRQNQIAGQDNTEKLQQIAKATGIDMEILQKVEDHVFRNFYDIPLPTGEIRRGRFTAMESILDLWEPALNGEIWTIDPVTGKGVLLDPAKAQQFKQLLAHEYIESRLMAEVGLPYRSIESLEDGVFWLSVDSAHDIAPLMHEPLPIAFKHWESLFGSSPNWIIADDLSNLDEIFAGILRILEERK